MHQVELVARKAFNQRRPSPNEGRAFGLKTFVLEEAHAMGDEQRCGVCDGKIADTNNIVVCRFRRAWKAAEQAGKRGCETACGEHVERLATSDTGLSDGLTQFADMGRIIAELTHSVSLFFGD